MTSRADIANGRSSSSKRNPVVLDVDEPSNLASRAPYGKMFLAPWTACLLCVTFVMSATAL